MTTARLDLAAIRRLDRHLRGALIGALLPLVALTAEIPFLWPAFRECGFELYGVLVVTVGFVAVRELLFKLFSPLFYFGFLAYQYDFFYDPNLPWSDPAQSRFWLTAVFAAACLTSNGAHAWGIVRLKRLPAPEELKALIGRPFARRKLDRQLAILQAADQAQENQAWVAQAGRQE